MQVLVDQEDAASYKQGEEVTLLRWGNVTITSITTAADGKVTALKVRCIQILLPLYHYTTMLRYYKTINCGACLYGVL